jgi:hypothetical protein
MKVKSIFLYPWLFTILAGLVYFLAFRSAWMPEDYTTMMLVICTAFGWSSIIFIKQGESHPLLKVYIILSIGFPLLFLEIFDLTAVDPIIHRITFGLMLLGMVFLHFFISMIRRK